MLNKRPSGWITPAEATLRIARERDGTAWATELIGEAEKSIWRDFSRQKVGGQLEHHLQNAVREQVPAEFHYPSRYLGLDFTPDPKPDDALPGPVLTRWRTVNRAFDELWRALGNGRLRAMYIYDEGQEDIIDPQQWEDSDYHDVWMGCVLVGLTGQETPTAFIYIEEKGLIQLLGRSDFPEQAVKPVTVQADLPKITARPPTGRTAQRRWVIEAISQIWGWPFPDHIGRSVQVQKIGKWLKEHGQEVPGDLRRMLLDLETKDKAYRADAK